MKLKLKNFDLVMSITNCFCPTFFLIILYLHQSTLARWIKSLLQLAGIDTSIFTGYSLRGAATTEALNQGVSITDILGMVSGEYVCTILL